MRTSIGPKKQRHLDIGNDDAASYHPQAEIVRSRYKFKGKSMCPNGFTDVLKSNLREINHHVASIDTFTMHVSKHSDIIPICPTTDEV